MSEPLPATGNTSQTRPENKAFYPALDGLRAIAFLMVWAQHYMNMPWGWSGVDLFFVLSGFLITGILWDTRDDPHRARNFYVRRTLRIFPLYYGVMLAMLCLQPVVHWMWTFRWLVWPAYLGNFARFIRPLTPGTQAQRLADFQVIGVFPHWGQTAFFLGHFWSLCVEEQFYLLWPWVVFFLPNRRKLIWICGASLVVCLALRLIGQQVLPDWMLNAEILYRLLPFRLDALLIGGLAALLLRGAQAEALLRASRWLTPVALLWVAAWVALSPFGHVWQPHYIYPPWARTWGLSVLDVLAVLLVLVVIQPGTWLYTAMKIRPLRWMGRITYGLYVFHDIPHNFYQDIGVRIHHDSRHAVALIALFCTCILAWLSFHFFETPFLNLKERWTVRSTGVNLERSGLRSQKG